MKKTRNELRVSSGSVSPQMYLVLLAAKSRPAVVSTPRSGGKARVRAGGRVCTAPGGSGELRQRRLSSAPAAEGSQMLLAPPRQHAVGGLPPFSPRWMRVPAGKKGFCVLPHVDFALRKPSDCSFCTCLL